MPADLIQGIGLAIVVAAGLAFAARALKQPVVLAYIAAGAIIGPHIGLHNLWHAFPVVEDEQSIEAISEIGLILMLFMIGLEIDLRELARAGQRVIVTGIVQFGAGVAISLGFFALLGYSIGSGRWDLAYLAVATSLSSTMVVVKLLYDKRELDTLAGRVTVGILVLQDLWAIVVLAIAPSLDDPQLTELALSLFKGALLVAGSLAVSRYVLGSLFRSIAKQPELMLVASVAWCFLIAGLASWAGLSRPMGALIAGISISTFPYNREVISKVISIRDFFITLFFVALGMKIPEPTTRLLWVAAAASVFVIFSRFVTVFLPLYLMRSGNRVSLLTSINLAQVSEFSVVIASVGLGLGHISAEVIGVLVFALAITATTSTYMIMYSHQIFLLTDRVLKRIGFRDIGQGVEDAHEEGQKAEIVILGFFRVASSLLDEIEKKNPRLLENVLVIDFNPEVNRTLTERGVRCIYGDIANSSVLANADIGDAKIVLSTIPDSLLKGINNLRLIPALKAACPNARICVTAETVRAAMQMYEAGADYVSLPRIDTATGLVNVILSSETAVTDQYRKERLEELQRRNEVLA